jgi:HSP20 family protein
MNFKHSLTKKSKDMTLVRFNNNKPAHRSFNNLVDDLFMGMPSIFRDDASTGSRYNAPVNISETENEYVLELVAPGWEKDSFRVNLEKNILTISAEQKKETEEKTERKILREFVQSSFKRSFTIDDQIDATQIVAKYVNGILTLNLPKKENVKEQTKEITIQ